MSNIGTCRFKIHPRFQQPFSHKISSLQSSNKSKKLGIVLPSMMPTSNTFNFTKKDIPSSMTSNQSILHLNLPSTTTIKSALPLKISIIFSQVMLTIFHNIFKQFCRITSEPSKSEEDLNRN